jgi:hypothetical protein
LPRKKKDPSDDSWPDDYLKDQALAAYFSAREHEAYYLSLGSANKRRDFHDHIKGAFIHLLQIVDLRTKHILDEIIARTVSRVTGPVECPITSVRRLEPKGLELLAITDDLDFDRLRDAYRKAALRYHPDRGGSNDEMVAINRAYEQLHAFLLQQSYGMDAAVEVKIFFGSLWTQPRTAQDYLWSVTRYLFEIALDDWALDEALVRLDRLTSDEFLRVADYYHPALIEPIAKLAIRLTTLAGARDNAKHCLAIAQARIESVQTQGLAYDSSHLYYRENSSELGRTNE